MCSISKAAFFSSLVGLWLTQKINSTDHCDDGTMYLSNIETALSEASITQDDNNVIIKMEMR